MKYKTSFLKFIDILTLSSHSTIYGGMHKIAIKPTFIKKSAILGKRSIE